MAVKYDAFKKNEMGILRWTESAMVKMMCNLKLLKRVKDLRQMLDSW